MHHVFRGLFALGVVALVGGVPLATDAQSDEEDERSGSRAGSPGEIHYGYVRDSRGDDMLIEYKGPWGSAYFTCDIDRPEDCSRHEGDGQPRLFPLIVGAPDYPRNDQGTLAVRQYIVSPSMVFYLLYDLSGEEPASLGRLPVTTPQADVRFADSGRHILFTDSTGRMRRYDVDTQQLTDPVMTAAQRPFFTTSYSGRYVASYNWSAQGHYVWDLTTGTQYTVPSGRESYLEFSDDETRASYLGDVGGFRTLYSIALADLPNPSPTRITRDNAEVEDHLWVGDTLYYLSNESHPLTWSLYAWDGEQSTELSDNASYGDYLKQVDDALVFIEIDGKNSLIATIEPARGNEKTVFAPVHASPLSERVARRSVYVGERFGALLSPADEDAAAEAETLFVWLHGGPMRQTSVGFHSYLSYAVYDELLEKIAEAGNYVLKLDYAGSTGYGKAFQDSLKRKIGTIDVRDVDRAVAELKDDYDIENVQLIGNSYGGYLALKALADDPEAYDGAISINGVTDWYGLIARIPSSPFKAIFDGVPDLHNLASYMQANVFTGLQNATEDNKVLVVYSEEDDQVPTWQSEQYIDFAQTQNVSLEKVTLPGEQHVIRERSSLTKLCNSIKDFIGVAGLACS